MSLLKYDIKHQIDQECDALLHETIKQMEILSAQTNLFFSPCFELWLEIDIRPPLEN